MAIKKHFNIIAMAIIAISFYSCHNKTEQEEFKWLTYTATTNGDKFYTNCIPEKMGEPVMKISTENKFEFFWNPPLLPISFSIDNKGNISVEGTAQISTFIGDVGINIGQEFSVEKRNKTINGINIEDSDFLIIFTDRKNKTNKVYKINKNTSLFGVLEGEVPFDAGSGYIKFDITNQKLKKIKFLDKSIIRLINSSDKPIQFTLSPIQKRIDKVGSYSQSGFTVPKYASVNETFNCTLPPKSVKNIFTEIRLIVTSVDRRNNPFNEIQVYNFPDYMLSVSSENEERVSTISSKICGGEVVNIFWDSSKQSHDITKLKK